MIRILLADDHAIVRNGLRQIMNGAPDMEIAGEATNGNQVLELTRTLAFDLLLLDMTMPGPNGTELIARLMAQDPAMRILVLSMYNESRLVRRVLEAGACGYVTKDSDQEVLLAAIRKVVAGGRFIDPALVDAIVFARGAQEAPPREVLSSREVQVLSMFAGGARIEEIADSLCLSAKTVSTHKARLMQKLNVTNNADLMRYAIRHGLADD